MRPFLDRIQLNLGIKRRLLMHPIVHELVVALTPHRLKLKNIPLSELVPGSLQVQVPALPFNPWDTPFNDLVPLCFLARSISAKRILEIGTCRGRGSLSLAISNPDATIITYDIDPAAGEYFKDRPEASRIDLRLIDIHQDLQRLRSEPAFDFIFVDGNHTQKAVERDSELAISLLSKNGMICWHDYAHTDWLLGYNAVPEVLARLEKHHKISAILGTALAVLQR